MGKTEKHNWRTPNARLFAGLTHLDAAGMSSSIAHLAYHLGAIRQISKSTRGPKEGTFP